MQPEFKQFDHQLFTFEYPIGWVNMTKGATRFFYPKSILAYGHKPKRTGFLGILAPIVDIIYWQPDAVFAVCELPLKEICEGIRSKTEAQSDEIIFDYIIDNSDLLRTEVEVIAKQKESLGVRRLYHLTVNNLGYQSEFRLVSIDEEVGLILIHSAMLNKLDDFKQTFERIVQSFRINR